MGKIIKSRISEIVDGDTFKISYKGSERTVRIACIDAPEMEQLPFGQSSKDALTGYIRIGARVRLKQLSIDRYGRIVAEARNSKGHNIGQMLVASGNAFVYRDFASQCHEKELVELEQKASSQRKGLWSGPAITYPWDYRASTEGSGAPEDNITSNSGPIIPSETQITMPKPTSPTTYVASEVPLYEGQRMITCAEIGSKSETIAWLAAGHTYLDADNDGCACESQFPC